MPTISKRTKDKISEQILAYLFQNPLESKFTSQIASEIARDEEFTKSLLDELEKTKLVIAIKKNQQGLDYKARRRWRLSNTAFEMYKNFQKNAKGSQTF